MITILTLSYIRNNKKLSLFIAYDSYLSPTYLLRRHISFDIKQNLGYGRNVVIRPPYVTIFCFINSNTRSILVRRTSLTFYFRSVISPVRLPINDIITCQKMMAFIISKLRKGPLTSHDLVKYGYLASTLNLKYAQPLMATMFSRVQIPRDELLYLFPNIKLVSDVFRWDTIFAAQYANHIFKNAPLFKNTQFTLLDAPSASPKQITGCEQKYKQTSQPFPDYQVLFKDTLSGDLTKYSDLKAGDFGPFAGNLVVTYNHASHEIVSKQMLEKHIQYFSTTYKNTFFLEELKKIRGKPKSWSEKNIEMQELYNKYIHLLPGKSPSMVFEVVQDYDLSQDRRSTLPIKSDTFMSPKRTQEVILECLQTTNATVRYNFTRSYGVNPTIRDIVLQDLKHFFPTTYDN